MSPSRVWPRRAGGALSALALLLAPATARAITGCDVLADAQSWVDADVPYSQGPYGNYCAWNYCYEDPLRDGICYRSDCSGFVSATWGLDVSLTTYTLDTVSYEIAWEDLAPGDAVIRYEQHVMLFKEWVDDHRFYAYEEYACGQTASIRLHDANTMSGYVPIRYDFIEPCEAACTPGEERCNGADDDCDGEVDEDEVCEREALLRGQPWLAPARTTDIDGDGRADVCGRGAAGVWCHLSQGGSWSSGGPPLGIADAAGWNDPANSGTLRMGDIDGDGRADLCARADAGVYCWKSNGTSLATEVGGPEWSDAGFWYLPEYYSTIRLLDIDADGKDDLCARGWLGIECYQSTGTGFGARVSGPAWSDEAGLASPRYYGTLRSGDVNGDGREDLCMRTEAGMECWLSDGNGFPTRVAGPDWSDAGGWGGIQYWSTIRLADVDGDGRADVCARGALGVRCHLSQGTAFGQPIEVAALSDSAGWGDPANYLTLRTGDVDGDGAQDLCIRADAGVDCYRYVSPGFERFASHAWSDGAGWALAQYFDTIQLGDMNGDGRDDLCARAAAGWLCAPSTGSGFGSAIGVGEFSDAQGWDSDVYYPSIMLGGPSDVATEQYANGLDDDGDGEVDEPDELQEQAGGSGGADAMLLPATGAADPAEDQGCALRAPGGGGRSRAALLVSAGVAVSLVRRRRAART